MALSKQKSEDKSWLGLQFHDENNKQNIKKPDQIQLDEKTKPPSINDEKLSDRIRGSMIGMAIGDALGAHVEFRPHNYLQANPVKDLQGGGTWGLEKGQFTDDTSMALCLANSLIACQDFVPYDQLVRYKWWYRNGYMSSTGHCFDIGAATRQSIQVFEERQKKFAQDHGISFDKMDLFASNPTQLFGQFDVNCSKDGVAGNGALMRLAPVPLFFYQHPIIAVEYSGISGRITHGDTKAYDACRYYGALIVATLKGEKKNQLTSITFYEDHKLWFGDEPLHPDIISIAQGSYQKAGGYNDGIRGKGYIVNALEAALWAFWSDGDSFEKGVLEAVNLGDDTDTTAAIYGQLAGAYYGYKKLPEKWRDLIYAKDFVLCVSDWIAYEAEKWSNKQKMLSEVLINSDPTSERSKTTILSNQKSYLSYNNPSSVADSIGRNRMSIIERKAIDPSGRIGSLYDVYRDCLVESSYFKLDFKNGIRPSSKCIIEKGEKIECQNLLQFIGFDDDFRLSLKSNIVNPMGIASVVEYPYLIDECTRVFYYSYTIRQECSSSDSIIRKQIQQWTSKSVATHLITGIDVGIDIIVILRLTSADSKIIDDTLNKIQESLLNDTILSMDKISLDGIVSTDIYSNINDLTTKKTLIDVYQSICQIKNNFDIYQSICQIKNNFDVYQPTNYILSSIQSFIKDNNKNYVTFIPLKPTIVQKIEQDLFRFVWINRMWLTTRKDDKYDILNTYLKEQLHDVENQLSAFKEQCTDENKRIQTLIINIRDGKYSENTLENELFNENIQIKLNKNREDLIHSITTLKEKGLFIEALQKEEFKYENANKYDIKQNDNENTIQRKLIGNNQNLYFLCSNDTLYNNNLSTLEQFISKLRKEKERNQNLKLIYVDFSYSPYELDQIKVFPLIHSIKAQNPHLSLLFTKKAIPRNPPPIDDKTINILFLGKSGAGKSTLINNLRTYLKHNREENIPSILPPAILPFVRLLGIGVDGAEEHRVVFGSHDPNENYDHPDQSTTQQCKLYSFPYNNQKLCIIDTPGFGKTHHQNNNDDINMQHILSRIINLTHLNAICVIIESGDDKLDDYHSCLTDLFNFLGENSVNNVLFCFTKVHSKDLNVNQKNHYLKLLVDSFLPGKIPFNENIIFDFDSSFFINSAMSNRFSSWLNPSNQISQQSWRTSKNGWNRLLTYIRQNLHRYSIQQGLEIVQLAKLEINQLIRPLLETIRNYFRNLILWKTVHSNYSIELNPISLLHPSAICYSCKRDYEQCAGFWITSDSPHKYQTTCHTCSCTPQQHVRIEYRLQFNCSNSRTQETSFNLIEFLYLSVHLAYFLSEGHYTTNNDILLLYLNKMINEEGSICVNFGSPRLNLALHDQLLNFRHNYQKQINTIKQKNIQNNFDIYDIIENVKQIQMVKIQLDASRKLQETSV